MWKISKYLHIRSCTFGLVSFFSCWKIYLKQKSANKIEASTRVRMKCLANKHPTQYTKSKFDSSSSINQNFIDSLFITVFKLKFRSVGQCVCAFIYKKKKCFFSIYFFWFVSHTKFKQSEFVSVWCVSEIWRKKCSNTWLNCENCFKFWLWHVLCDRKTFEDQ